MRISICEDDKIQASLLEAYIKEFFILYKQELPEILIYYSGEELLNSPPYTDLLFLDIKLSDVDGITIGEKLTKSNPRIKIIITTSYMEYLDDAMRFNVFRYINKPIDKNRLFKSIKDFLKNYKATSRIIPIETKTGVISLATHNIIQVVAESKKVFVHTTEGIFVSTHKMDYWENKLSETCFFKSHRSYIINLDYVKKFNHDTITLHNCNSPAYLTCRKYTEFKQAYLLYSEDML